MRKETDNLGFYYTHMCFQTFADKYVAIGRTEWGQRGGGFVNIHALAGSFIFSFSFTDNRKNQVTDIL